MLIHPQIDPVALQLGPLAVHWYGLTYLAAFGLFYWLGTRRLGHLPFKNLSQWQKRDIEDILFLGVLGVILGGRIGYCLFYKPAYYLANPLEVFAVWQGGMSFHGGMLGVIAAMADFYDSLTPAQQAEVQTRQGGNALGRMTATMQEIQNGVFFVGVKIFRFYHVTVQTHFYHLIASLYII